MGPNSAPRWVPFACRFPPVYKKQLDRAQAAKERADNLPPWYHAIGFVTTSALMGGAHYVVGRRLPDMASNVMAALILVGTVTAFWFIPYVRARSSHEEVLKLRESRRGSEPEGDGRKNSLS